MRRKLILISLMLILSCVTLFNTSHPAQAAPGDVLERYPVVPVISGRTAAQMRYLLRLGGKAGNRRDVFSKVGDSITSFRYFLTPINTGGLRLGAYGNLLPTVSYFSQEVARSNFSFANESLAAHGGWTSGDVLDPGKATPGICGRGETPLDCELRVSRPSVALIMFGTNDLPYRNVSVFRANIDQILTITEAHGVIPVVSTIPMRKDKAAASADLAAYNLAIIAVARAHAAPIWNYWLAMQNLPDNGISTDMLHPSVPPDQNTTVFDDAHLRYGFPMRNLTALEVLNALLPYLKR